MNNFHPEQQHMRLLNSTDCANDISQLQLPATYNRYMNAILIQKV